jgi:hypothetical protein
MGFVSFQMGRGPLACGDIELLKQFYISIASLPITRKSVSETLAKLIEETYGYSSQRSLCGTGERLTTNVHSAIKNDILEKIQKKTEAENSGDQNREFAPSNGFSLCGILELLRITSFLLADYRLFR